MRLRPSLLVSALLVCVSGAAIFGCGGQDHEQDAARATGASLAPSPGGMAVVAIADEPDVLNSLVRTTAVAGMVLSLVQAGLVEMGEDLAWEPMIATDWELAPDSLAITYRLRPWRWEDGAPLTAADVVLSC